MHDGKESKDNSFKVVYSDQQHLKLYSFVRNTLTDSDYDVPEDS